MLARFVAIALLGASITSTAVTPALAQYWRHHHHWGRYHRLHRVCGWRFHHRVCVWRRW